MALVGDLGSVDLAQVFQVLAQNQKDGVLDVFRGDYHRGLRFRRGAVTLQFDRDAYEERAVELLQRLGRISEEKLHLAAANRHGTDAALVDVLIEMGALSEDEVIALFRERMAEELYELFSWLDARFEFHEGAVKLDGAGGEIDERFVFPADAVVMEAARRLDEWAQIQSRVPDEGEVFAPQVDELVPDDDLQAAVFTSIDGARSVAQVCAKLARSRFEVSKSVSKLVDRGAVAPLRPDEYPESGRTALAADRPADAANLFDRAAAAQVELPDTIGEAGRAWEAAHEPARAAERFVAYGDALLAQERLSEALAAFKHAHALVPTHLEAWRKEVFLAVAVSAPEARAHGRAMRSPAALEQGRALGEVFHELGESEKAIDVLDRVLEHFPRDLASRRLLVSALEHAGDGERLCEQLEAVAETLAAEGDAVGAAASLQRVLRLRPDRKDLSHRIRDLYRSDERRRTRRRALTIGFVSSLLLGSVAFLAYSRERSAKLDLEALDVPALLQLADLRDARARLDEYVATHALTLAVNDAHRALERIDTLEAEARDRENQRIADEAAARQGRVASADRHLKLADEKARSGKLAEAVTELKRGLALAPPDWSSGNAARKNVADLEQYLAAGRALAAEAAQQRAKSDWPAARRALRNLVARHPLTPEAHAVTLPFVVTTVPPGATVEMDGVALGASPLVIEVAAGSKAHELRARMPGYATVTAPLDPASDAPIELRMGRAPESSVTLVFTPTAPMSVVGGRAVVALPSARIATLDAAGGIAWSTPLVSQAEIVQAPAVENGAVYGASADGVVGRFDPASGNLVWRRELNAALRVPLKLMAEGVCVATDDGRVRLLDRARGETLREWRPGPRPAGTIAAAAGALAIGCADGRIRVLDFKQPSREDLWINLGVPVAALALDEGVLLASGDDGRLGAFEASSGRRLFDVQGGRIASPRPLARVGRFFVDRAGKVAAVEPATGRVLMEAKLSAEPAGDFVDARGALHVALRDGSVVALRENDFAIDWSWPGVRAAGEPSIAADDTSLFVLHGRTLQRFDLTRGR